MIPTAQLRVVSVWGGCVRGTICRGVGWITTPLCNTLLRHTVPQRHITTIQCKATLAEATDTHFIIHITHRILLFILTINSFKQGNIILQSIIYAHSMYKVV